MLRKPTRSRATLRKASKKECSANALDIEARSALATLPQRLGEECGGGLLLLPNYPHTYAIR